MPASWTPPRQQRSSEESTASAVRKRHARARRVKHSARFGVFGFPCKHRTCPGIDDRPRPQRNPPEVDQIQATISIQSLRTTWPVPTAAEVHPLSAIPGEGGSDGHVRNFFTELACDCTAVSARKLDFGALLTVIAMDWARSCIDCPGREDAFSMRTHFTLKWWECAARGDIDLADFPFAS
jgi:hypothetical protein